MHGFPPATHMHAPGANVPAPQAITVTPHPRPPAAAAGPPATAAVPLVPHDIVAPQAAVPLSAAVASMHRAASADAGGFKRPRPVRASRNALRRATRLQCMRVLSSCICVAPRSRLCYNDCKFQ